MTVEEMYHEISNLHKKKMELSEQRKNLIYQDKMVEALKLTEEINKLMNEISEIEEKIRKEEMSES